MPTPNDFYNFQFSPNRNAAGGDYSPTADAAAAPAVSHGNYPNLRTYGYDATNRQFTTRPEFATEEPSIPELLHESTRASVEAHADLNEAYGLCQPEATLGCHPWLRDELAEPSPAEPGNAEPYAAAKVPFNETTEAPEELGNFAWENSASRGS
jgi:hypothetical protein